MNENLDDRLLRLEAENARLRAEVALLHDSNAAGALIVQLRERVEGLERTEDPMATRLWEMGLEEKDKRIADLEATLRKAYQLATVATDWNLDEVEIDGEMMSTYTLREEFNLTPTADAEEGKT